MASPGLLLIGLDGGTWKLLKKWIADGTLPNLARLYANGTSGILLSTVPSATCPAVPSLLTGKNPGNLGVFDFVDPYGAPIRLDRIRDKKIWNVLDDHDLSSCLVDVRFTYPPEPLNGVMVSGIPIPKEIDSACYPHNLEERLGRKVATVTCFRKHLNYGRNLDRSTEQVLKVLRDYVEERYALIRQLTSERHFDFVFTWFGDIDAVQHMYWHHQDTIQRHLRLVDDQIGRLAHDFADRNIILMSDHGFHKAATRRFLVNMWLRQQGVLGTKGTALMGWLFRRAAGIVTRFVGRKRLLKLLGRTQKADGAHPGEKVVLGDNYRNLLPGVNWKTTKAYFRKPWGIQIIRANLSDDYERFRERLIDRMRMCRDPQGRPVFPHVWKKEEVFAGKYLSQIPDIIYQIDEEYRADPIISNGPLIQKDIRYFKEELRILRTGSHTDDRQGIFLAVGPDFLKGTQIEPAHIEDIAPTIYHLLGCAIPDDLDGKVLRQAFTDRLRNQQPKYYTPAPPREPEGVKEISHEEEESIKQQLKDMGYLQD